MSKKQKDFCKNYVANGGNATQAALDAGYSSKSARSIASENLTKPNIKNYIAEQYRDVVGSPELNVEIFRRWLKMTRFGLRVRFA